MGTGGVAWHGLARKKGYNRTKAMTSDLRPNPALRTSRRAAWGRAATFAAVCLALTLLFYPYVRPYLGEPADKIPWQTNLNDALAKARQAGKPVLVDFSASWCPPCQEMKRKSWPEAQVGQVVAQNYIPVLMDVDRPDAQAAAQKYGVETIPAIFVLDGQGNVIRRGEFMSTEELLKFLEPGSLSS